MRMRLGLGEVLLLGDSRGTGDRDLAHKALPIRKDRSWSTMVATFGWSGLIQRESRSGKSKVGHMDTFSSR